MEAKTFEVRDRGTFIPILAVQLEPSTEADRYLLARAGFGTDAADQKRYVLLIRIEGSTEVQYDDLRWPNQRTLGVAHRYIIEMFNDLDSGDVVDVELILGETDEPKVSEALGGIST